MLLALSLLVSAGCQTAPPFADVPEPWRASFQRDVREQPDSQFARACRGDQAALHAYFAQSLQPLDGADGETFDASMSAFYESLGQRRFLAAVAREPVDVQQAMRPVVARFTTSHRAA